MFENKQWKKIAINKDKIDALVQENYMRIYKYCYYHVHNRDVAQDITQDVFRSEEHTSELQSPS